MLSNHSLILRGSLFLFFFGAPQAVEAAYTRNNFYDIRWLARANTGVAIIADGTAAFYNPAGLARNNTFQFAAINPSFGLNQNLYESAVLLLGGGSDESLSDQLAPILGKQLAGNAVVFPNFKIPNAMLGYWHLVEEGLEYRNPVDPNIDINIRHDKGIILGAAFDVMERLYFGASIRYQTRNVFNETLSGADVLNNSLTSLQDDFSDGVAWGLNLGMQYAHEFNKNSALNFGLAVEDFGFTRFRNNSIGQSAPEKQVMKINSGLAYTIRSTTFDSTFLFDMRDLGDSNLSYTKKIFLGVEFNTLIMDIRGGFYQGYWTAGISMAVFPMVLVDLTTYAEEIDSYASLRANRIWMLSLRTTFELSDKKVRKKQKYTLDHL